MNGFNLSSRKSSSDSINGQSLICDEKWNDGDKKDKNRKLTEFF